jgi:flagellin-like hook-associated protein FlgL
MKSLAQAAKTSGNTSDLSTQYNAIISQVAFMAEDSSYGGQNLLNNDSLSVEFNEDGSNTLSVSGFSAAGTGFIAGVSLNAANFASNNSIESGAVSEIDAAITNLRTEAQKLSSSLSTIQIRADFTDQMENTLSTGADNLTLADMNEEGANMLMLQTRQNLGTTSLSLASQAAQAVLQLF